jgi:hypothetical protein
MNIKLASYLISFLPRYLAIFLTIICYFSLSTLSIAAISGGSSDVEEGSSPYKDFSESAVGVGLSIGARLNLAEDIFTSFEEFAEDQTELNSQKLNPKNKNSDHIFSEIEVFGNQFFSGEIKQNFGGRINLGYEIKGIRIFTSGGYVASTVDYQETNNTKQSVTASAPFFGIGIGYDITKNVSLRLNSMFYSFDFTPKNSQFKNVEVEVSSLNLGVAFHF